MDGSHASDNNYDETRITSPHKYPKAYLSAQKYANMVGMDEALYRYLHFLSFCMPFLYLITV